MPELAPRLACPVCLGVTMDRVSVGPGGGLQLDHCRRCGGLWLEHGEVQRLRSHAPASLWGAIPRRDTPFHMHCHDCRGLMTRAEKACPSCGWNNVLDCPACDRPMQVESHSGLRLDVCRECKGVWFDHHELAEIWKESFDRSVQLRRRKTRSVAGEAGDVAEDVLLSSIFFAPDLLFYGAYAAGHAASASLDAAAALPGAIGSAPELASSAVEAVGEASSGVFEVVVNIISGIFDSF